MQEKQLLKLLLDHSFFTENRAKLARSMFPNPIDAIFDTIADAHERYQRNLTVSEIQSLHFSNNPTLTRATRTEVATLLDEVGELPDEIGADVARDVLSAIWRTELARRIADAALDFGDGKIDFSGVARLLDNAGTVDQSSTLPVVDTGLDTILAATERFAAWKFAIPTLAERVAGISGGEFAIAFARPEIGKTAFWVTLVAAGARTSPSTGEVFPGGFLDQGAKVLAICNEEPANRTILRALTCCTGKTKEQLLADPESIRKQWDTIRRNLVVIDAATVSVKELEVLVAEHKPDVVIVDQLDKVQIDGQFNRGDESLTELYRRAREIAKRNNCAVFAICQASADAEGKAYVHYSTLAGSKTGKAGEADLIIGIGVDIDPGRPNDDLTRTLYVSKNKLTGWHGPVTCILNPQVSRYES